MELGSLGKKLGNKKWEIYIFKEEFDNCDVLFDNLEGEFFCEWISINEGRGFLIISICITSLVRTLRRSRTTLV